jgi:hypothetical protein
MHFFPGILKLWGGHKKHGSNLEPSLTTFSQQGWNMGFAHRLDGVNISPNFHFLTTDTKKTEVKMHVPCIS